ncbi:E3 ubiquitin-protein ligase TRIM71-like [Mytilus trossulus]|uniref:E3 ubiquitin-protein ligase TRIM71-like n=1 Tax=Mytilus trossulus TaxID=6551 RepID=UPI003004089D
MASNTSVPCGPCERGNANTKADIWCFSCHEGLCSTCAGQHKRFKPTGDHKTIDIESYKSPIDTIKTECDKHNQQFKWYCPSHLIPCCDACISNHHSKCTEIKPLASVVEKANIEQSKASIENDITSILLFLNKMGIEKSKNRMKAEQQHKNIKESIGKIRQEINKHLEHLEIELYKEADTKWSKEKLNLTELITEIEEKKKNLKDIQHDLQTVTEKSSKLQSFLGIHQIERIVHRHRYVVDIEHNEMAREVEIKLKQNDKIEKILRELRSIKSFGEVNIVETKLALKRETSVNMEPQVALQEQSNIKTMQMNIETKMKINLGKYINDMICLMDGRFIVVEQSGKVNLFSTDGKLQKLLPIASGPWSVTQINQDAIAMSYPQEKDIKVFNMKNETVSKVITLDKPVACYGLSCFNDALAVGLRNREIRIIDMDGNTLKSIQVQSKSHLYNLVYFNDRVIFSDYTGKAVYCYEDSGKIVWEYKQDLDGPQGLCIDTFGNILVADYCSDRIIAISIDGKISKVVLGKEDGLEDMHFICYKKDESYGFICDNMCVLLAKFNLSYG